MNRCDLHCHSCFSDGSLTPEELIDLACQAGLTALALTDHNTLDGLARAARAAEGRLNFCGGCELTTEADGQELHLLGLFLTPENSVPRFRALAEQTTRKEQSNREVIERLSAAGYPLTYAEFIENYGTNVKNRVHIARYLMEKGIVSSVSEAFQGLLSLGAGFYHETKKLNFYEMIPLIAESGGLSVWAHPLFHVDRADCERILRKAKSCGLDGAECYYTTYSDDDTAFMKRLCRDYGLLESGGSDFHGENKPDIQLGTGYGELCVPYACYEAMRARHDSLTVR